MSDYISREAAIEAMYEDAEAHPEHTFWFTQHKALRNIPAADVRPVVRGKWVWNEAWVYGNPYGSYRCTACSAASPHTSYFCPNCGADMREES